MFPFPKLWGCKYTDKILIINNFMNIFESRFPGRKQIPPHTLQGTGTGKTPPARLTYIGNQMKTAASHRACEMTMAGRRDGKNRYKAPQAAPATRAAITSMKLKDGIWTAA